MEQPEAAPDLVGRTSARLLAAGIVRRERLEALHLLAILDASVDASGRVRRPLDDLAGEFELAPLSVMRSLDHLVQAGAVQRDGAGVVLLGGRDGLGGLQLADFLDDVRASFDGATSVPTSRRSTLLARSGSLLAAAAAAVALFTLAPSSGVQTPVALRGVAETTIADRLDDADSLDAPADIDRTIRPTTTIVAPMSSPALDTDVLAATSPTTACPATPTTTEAPLADVAAAVDDDLAACLDEHGLVITGVTLAGPTIDERATVDPSPRADAVAPVGVDDAEAVDTVDAVEAPTPTTTDHVARTIRS